MKYYVTVEGEDFEIEVGCRGQVWVNRRPLNVEFCGLDASRFLLLLENRSYETCVERVEGERRREYVTRVSGRPYRTILQRGRKCSGNGGNGSGGSSVKVCAPLPGLLLALTVKPGQYVREGEVVAVLESMKMNLELRAPKEGVVKCLYRSPGTEVSAGEALVVIGT
ncbi:MAG: acetyl-CoA carboxylase biotin carboxyl carrier protein subunit [Anaerolineae bacterium]|nr:acetyl-CoA carboxylase biotin carboxyl carrier protein subunit [Anaerolineae bacterium]